MLGAHPWQSSPRGCGDSCTWLETRSLIDSWRLPSPPRAFAASTQFALRGKLPLVFSLTTRMCLVHGNSVMVVDKYRILTNAPSIQPPACAGHFVVEGSVSCVRQAVCCTASFSLCRTTTRTSWTATSTIWPWLPRYASPRRASPVCQRSPRRLRGKLTRRPTQPQRSCGGLRLPGVAIREVVGGLVYDPEFHAEGTSRSSSSSLKTLRPRSRN